MNSPAGVADVVPAFGIDFDALLDFLHVDGTPGLSPQRFAQVLGNDPQAIASLAHVHLTTLSHAPESEGVQRFLRESIRVVRAAADIRGNVDKALFWFKNTPLPAFEYKTPQDLVAEGRADDLISYLQSLQAGFAG